MSEPQKEREKFPLKELGELFFFVLSPPIYCAKKVYDWVKRKEPKAPPSEPVKPE